MAVTEVMTTNYGARTRNHFRTRKLASCYKMVKEASFRIYCNNLKGCAFFGAQNGDVAGACGGMVVGLVRLPGLNIRSLEELHIFNDCSLYSNVHEVSGLQHFSRLFNSLNISSLAGAELGNDRLVSPAINTEKDNLAGAIFFRVQHPCTAELTERPQTQFGRFM